MPTGFSWPDIEMKSNTRMYRKLTKYVKANNLFCLDSIAKLRARKVSETNP